MDIHQFIKERPYLIWYVSKENLGKLNDESIVEHVLNYGNWDDVQKMIEILESTCRSLKIHVDEELKNETQQ